MIPPNAKIDYEKKTVTYRARGRKCRAVLTNKGRMRIESNCYHIEFRDHLDRRQRLIAFTDKQASDLLGAQVKKLLNNYGQPIPEELSNYVGLLRPQIKDTLKQMGLLPQEEVDTARPLKELLAKFEETLQSRERSKGYVTNKLKYCRQMAEACHFDYFRDIQPGRIERYLREQREGPKKWTAGTSNRCQQAVEQFANWVVERTHLAKSPLKPLEKLTEDPEERRALSKEEFACLLRATCYGPELYGMSGQERYLLYWFAVRTGLRAREIRSLRKADFDFDECKVTVPARKTKNKKQARQSFDAGLAAELKTFMAAKLPTSKAFGGWYKTLTNRTADMMKADLKAAGLPYRNEIGEKFDFHALRVECATLLFQVGIDIKTVQSIMRHSDPTLTMNIYGKVDKRQREAAINKLPDFSLGAIDPISRTGTDDGPCKNLRQICLQPGQSIENTLVHNGQDSLNNTGKTALSANDSGSKFTENQLSQGSNPCGPIDSNSFPLTDLEASKAESPDLLPGAKSGKSIENLRGEAGQVDPDLALVNKHWRHQSLDTRRKIVSLIDVQDG